MEEYDRLALARTLLKRTLERRWTSSRLAGTGKLWPSHAAESAGLNPQKTTDRTCVNISVGPRNYRFS